MAARKSTTPRKTTRKSSKPTKVAVVADAAPELDEMDDAIDEPMLAEETEAEADGAAKAATLRKKEFVERVTTLSGRKKQDVREITEAVLAVLGEALSKGEELNLPPLGKIKVNRQRDLTSGEMMIVKLRRAGEKETGTPPLADDEE